MTLEELKKYQKILILGYGTEGKTTHEFLKRNCPEAEIIITDKKADPDYLSKQEKVDLIIKTPGIPKNLVKKPYTTATNIFFANVKGKTIGITGTKGKSTTASLIHHILKTAGKSSHLVGNIGNPALLELSKSNNPKDIFVIELSSYQLDDIQFSPDISVILNIFPDHMNYHGDVESYYRAKLNIIAYATKEDYFIYNPKYEKLCQAAEATKARSLPITDDIEFDISEIKLKGEHNLGNVKAAMTVAKIFKIPDETIKRAILSFQPLTHRLEYIGRFKEIDFYNDAASTTPQSTIASLNSLDNIQTLFLGGQDRGYDFAELVALICKSKIENIVLFPDSGKTIKTILENSCQRRFNILETDSMAKAVEFAYSHTQKDVICLLSTACPSYSLWKNFSEKGNQFKEQIKLQTKKI